MTARSFHYIKLRFFWFQPFSISSFNNQLKTNVADNAPQICASKNIGTFPGLIPAKVFETERANVTAGFANEVEAVNQ